MSSLAGKSCEPPHCWCYPALTKHSLAHPTPPPSSLRRAGANGPALPAAAAAVVAVAEAAAAVAVTRKALIEYARPRKACGAEAGQLRTTRAAAAYEHQRQLAAAVDAAQRHLRAQARVSSSSRGGQSPCGGHFLSTDKGTAARASAQDAAPVAGTHGRPRWRRQQRGPHQQ